MPTMLELDEDEAPDVTCPWCGGRQWSVDGCSRVAYLQAYRHGTEPHFTTELHPHFGRPLTAPERCNDCGARIGFHHHVDCLHARCSVCGDQAACCDHNVLDEP